MASSFRLEQPPRDTINPGAYFQSLLREHGLSPWEAEDALGLEGAQVDALVSGRLVVRLEHLPAVEAALEWRAWRLRRAAAARAREVLEQEVDGE